MPNITEYLQGADPEDVRCEYCVHFRPDPGTAMFGRCLRHAPATGWPKVAAGDRCGEFVVMLPSDTKLDIPTISSFKSILLHETQEDIFCDDCIYLHRQTSECRRRSPGPTGWPKTDAESFCGEFELKTLTDSPAETDFYDREMLMRRKTKENSSKL